MYEKNPPSNLCASYITCPYLLHFPLQHLLKVKSVTAKSTLRDVVKLQRAQTNGVRGDSCEFYGCKNVFDLSDYCWPVS